MDTIIKGNVVVANAHMNLNTVDYPIANHYQVSFLVDIDDENLIDENGQILSNNQVVENAAFETYTGLTAFSEDLDLTDTVTYRLVTLSENNQLEEDVDGPYQIDSTSGVVTVKDGSQLDFGYENYVYPVQTTIRIEALSSDGSTTNTTFPIYVNKANEFPTSISLDNFSVDEDIPEFT